jgi:hypothetical protein
LRGELRACGLLAGVGEPGKIADGLIDPFFLMDKGSISVGAEVKPLDVLGFGVSVLPVGKKGWRLLRGILETGFE